MIPSRQKIPIYLLSAFAFCIPIWLIGANICIFALLLYSFIYYKESLTKISGNWFSIGCLLFAGLYIITWVFSPTSANWFEVEKRLGFIAIPILIGLYIDNKNIKAYITTAFTLGVLLINIRAIWFMGIELYHTGSLSLINGNIDNLLHYPRPFLGLLNMICIGIAIQYYYQNKEKKVTVYLFIISLIGFVVITITGARFAFMTSLIIITYFIYLIILKNQKLIVLLSTIIALIILFTFIGYNQVERFKNIKKNEPRLFIWKNALSIISHNSITEHIIGLGGEVATQQELNKGYRKETEIGLYTQKNHKEVISFLEKNDLTNEFNIPSKKNLFDTKAGKWWWIYADNINFNTHNQYLSAYLSYGIVGLALLFNGIFFFIHNYWKQESIQSLLFVIIFFGVMLVENILAKQVGIFTFLLFGGLTTVKKN